jgi:hypothetical protein
MAIKTIYEIPAPYTDNMITVYGEPDMGWYEWRVTKPNGHVIEDSHNHQYGSPGVALRDALNYVTTFGGV